MIVDEPGFENKLYQLYFMPSIREIERLAGEVSHDKAEVSWPCVVLVIPICALFGEPSEFSEAVEYVLGQGLQFSLEKHKEGVRVLIESRPECRPLTPNRCVK